MKKISFLFIIIYIFSILSIIYSILDFNNAYYSKYYNNKISATSQALKHLKRDSNEIFALQKELNNFYVMLYEDKCEAKDLENRIDKFKKSGFDFVKLRFFDKQNKLINLKNTDKNDVLSGAMQRLYIALAEYKLHNDETMIKRYRSLFETVLGAVNIYSLAKETSTLIPVSFGGKAGYIYWNLYENEMEIKDFGGMLVWFKKSDIPPYLLSKIVVNKYNYEALTQKNSTLFGFTDLKKNNNLYPTNLPDTFPELNYNDLFIKIQEMNASFRSHDVMGGYIFQFTEVDNDCYFIALTKINSDYYYSFWSWGLVLLVLIPGIYLCYLLFKHIKQIENQADKQIILKPVLITATVFGISMLGFLLAVNLLIHNINSQNKKELIYTDMRSAINWLDEGYNLAKKELSEKYLTLSKKDEIVNINKDYIDKTLSPFVKNHTIERMFLANKDGNILYSYPNDKNVLFYKIIPVIARKAISDRLGTEENWKSKIDKMMINTVSSSFTDLLGEGAVKLLNAFENFDVISELELGNKQHFVFTTIVNEQKSDPLAVIILADSKFFKYDYLINKLKDLQALPENIRNISLAMVPVHYDEKPFPPEITKYSFAIDITERVAYSKQTTDFETMIGGKEVYGTGTKLHNFSDFVIFALHDKK